MQIPAAFAKPRLATLKPYQVSTLAIPLWQTASTFALYLAVTSAMYASTRISVFLTLALAIPASGLIVRIFMLQHDCGHNSLFRSARANRCVGGLCSLVTLTPFAYWRRLHARHHGSWNNLDGRGIPADFFSDCLTSVEYAALRPIPKLIYRITHLPALTHFVLPPLVFIVLYRLPFDTPAACRRERISVYLLDFALVCLSAALIEGFGLRRVLLVHLPALALAAIIGIWLFAVQHRFEDAQWTATADWKHADASLHGTSYLKLPAVLRWFSANIGLHHVHHLRPGIPNYRLQACHDGCPDITAIATVLTLAAALKAPTYALWDENLGRMVPFPI